MNKQTEIEIEVQVETIEKFIKFLKNKAKFVREERQVDKYFTPYHRDFTRYRPVKEWLRLRYSPNKYFINYKNWHIENDGKSYYCDEFESKIGDIKQFENIFNALNFKLLVTVDKIRKIWVYKNYEIALDSVKRLGEFVEIEYKNSKTIKKPKEITGEMIRFLKDKGCGRILRNYVGYPFLKLFPGEVKVEEC